MTSPQETRDQINAIRNRVFKKLAKDSTRKTPRGNDQAAKTSDAAQMNEVLSDGLKPTNFIELQHSAEILSKFESSVEERQHLLAESFSDKLKLNDDRISLLSSDTHNKLSEISTDFADKSSSLEMAVLEKLEHTFKESNSKVNGIEQLVNNSIISSSQASEALKEELDKLSSTIRLDINSVVERFSSSNQKIETELQHSAEILSKFESSVEERQHLLAESFSEKLKLNDDRISLLSSDTHNKLSEISTDFADKSSGLEMAVLEKLEHTLSHLAKVEKQVENQIGDLSSSLQRYVSSIVASQEEKIEFLCQKVNFLQEKLKSDISGINSLVLTQQTVFDDTVSNYALAADKKIDAQAYRIQHSIKSLKQDISKSQSDLKAGFDQKINTSMDTLQDMKKNYEATASGLLNKIEESELKTNDYLSNKIFEVHEMLSGELTVLKDGMKEKHFELTKHIGINVSAVTEAVEKDRKHCNNRFEKIEAMFFKDNLDLFNHFKKDMGILNETLGARNDSLSHEFKTLIEDLQKDISKKIDQQQIEGYFNQKISEKLNVFSGALEDRFSSVTDTINSIESMIVKEENLTELFQNYSLNVNILGSDPPGKSKFLSKSIAQLSALKSALSDKTI